jgi:uracil-DNA glycosylase family 4
MPKFNSRCQLCPRLAQHLTQVRRDHPDYHARPVAPFGDKSARLLIVGLAPGMHGANRTGRPFTGDHAGILLYQSLYDFGFSNRPESVSAADSLKLNDCRITNAVKCLPPENKPQPSEIAECNGYLKSELAVLAPGTVLLALGTIAHKAILQALELRLAVHPFKHGAYYRLPNRLQLLDSYHCSRYNTQTKRLTPAMFRAVLKQAQKHMSP